MKSISNNSTAITQLLIALIAMSSVLSQTPAQCEALIMHDQQICHFSNGNVGEKYNFASKIEYCQSGDGGVNGDYDTFNYCKKDVCDFCSLNGLNHSLYFSCLSKKNLSNRVYSVGGLANDCQMSPEEACIREERNESISEMNPTTNGEDHCCVQECQNKFSSSLPGCASSIAPNKPDFYASNSITSLCTDYCDNYTVEIDPCTNNTCNHVDCPFICVGVPNFPQVDVCAKNSSGDFVLVTDRAALCTGLTTPVEYSEYNICDGECDTAECQDLNCVTNLEDAGLGQNICSNKMLFEPLLTYCGKQRVDNTVSEIKCNGSNCASESECCMSACVDEYDNNGSFTLTPLCSSTFQYHSSASTYCTELCNSASKTVIEELCSGNTCSELQCFQLDCVVSKVDVCSNDSTWTHLTPNEWCAELFTDPAYLTNTCPAPCSDLVCEVEQCKDNLSSSVYSSASKYCGNDGVFYETPVASSPEEICVRIADDQLQPSGLINCDDNGSPTACADSNSCCMAKCRDNHTPFSPKCNSNGHNWFDTLEDLCISVCASNAFTQCIEGGNDCDITQCCEKKCDANVEENVCDNNYDLLIQDTYCKAKCPPRVAPTVHNCAGGCDNRKCAVLECLNTEFVSATSQNVCGYRTTAEVGSFYTREQYCELKQDHNDVVKLTCSGSECLAQDECMRNICLEQNSGNTYVKQCNTAFVIYETAADFCEAVHINTQSIAQCGGFNCTPLECCTSFNTGYLDTCRVDDHTIQDANLYCTRRYVDNDPDFNDVNNCQNAQSSQIDCVNCRSFQCTTQTSSYSLPTVCLNRPVDFFFASKNAYCVFEIANISADYSIQNSLDCGDNQNGCASETACCEAKCLTENYDTVCSLSTFAPMTQAEYCTNLCGTALPTEGCSSASCSVENCRVKKCLVDNTTFSATMNICLERPASNYLFANSVDNYCTAVSTTQLSSYEILSNEECSDATNGCDDGTECCSTVCNNGAYVKGCLLENTTYNLQEQNDWCPKLCANPALILSNCLDNQDNIIECTNCNVQQCSHDLKAAYQNADNYCSNTYLFFDIEAHCKIQSASGLTPQFCKDQGGADVPCQNSVDCCQRNCVIEFTSPFTPQCSSSVYDFHQTVEQYCGEYCPSRSFTTYQVNNSNANEVQCDFQKCIQPSMYVCYLDTVSSLYERLKDQDSCNVPSRPKQICTDASNAQVDCSQDDCKRKTCELEILDNYNSEDVCSTKDQFFTTKDLFCDSYVADITVELRQCNNAPCANDIACCTANCNAVLTPYVAQCDNTQFLWKVSRSEYCDAFCVGGQRTFTPYHSDVGNTILGTETECAIEKCKLNGPNVTTSVCEINNNYDYLSETQTCEEYHNNLVNYDLCGGNCSTQECSVIKCNTDFLQANSGFTSVCGDNSTLYTTVREYCIAKFSTNTIDSLLCGGLECQNTLECFQANCLETETTGYQATCDITFNDYPTVATFCQAKATAQDNGDPFNVLQCGNQDCNNDQCCTEECKSDNQEFDVCSKPTQNNPSALILKASHCSSKCTAPNWENDIIRCTGVNCESSDCAVQQCIFEMNQYDGDVICGKGGIVYTDLESYCLGQSNNPANVVSACGTPNCIDQLACCNQDCQADNSSGYGPRCNTQFLYLETHVDYCSSKCALSQSYEDLMCNSSFCTKLECCVDECDRTVNPYTPSCSANYGFLSRRDFCEEECIDPNTNIVTHSCLDDNAQTKDCTGTEDCSVEKCMSVGVSIADICKNDEIAPGFFFFATKRAYCKKKVELNQTDYEITDNISCGGGPCTASSCCESRCLTGSFTLRCNKDDNYNLLDEQDYCVNQCDANAQFETHICQDSQSQDINCTLNTCKLQHCEDSNTAYTLSSVCLNTPIVGTTENFYQSQQEYCQANIDENVTAYEIGAGFTNCGGNACDDDSCCEALCMDETFFTSCDSGDNLIVHSSFCSARCAGNTPTLNPQCEDGSNNPVDCLSCDPEIHSCLYYLQTNNFSDDNICIDGTKNGLFYFENHLSFCQAMKQDSDTDFAAAIALNLQCSGSQCADQNNCEEQRCLQEAFLDSCHPTSLTHITKEVRCANHRDILTFDTCTGGSGTVACTPKDCCLKELTQSNYTDNVCHSGNLMTNEDFCNGSNLTKVECPSSNSDIFCTDTECCNYQCLLNFPNGQFPMCGANFEHYANNTDFCIDRCPAKTLSLLPNCPNGGCSEKNCCSEGCKNEPLIAVLLIEDHDSLQAFINQCDLDCQLPNHNSANVHTCPQGKTKEDCEDDFHQNCNFCTIFDSANSNKKYCTRGENGEYMSRELYCQKYLCPEGPQYGQTFLFSYQCDPSSNTCSETQCENSQCKYDKCQKHINDPNDRVCASDGNLYENVCVIGCDSALTFLLNCSDLAPGVDCNAECIYRRDYSACQLTNPQHASIPACAINGVVYDDYCRAKALFNASTPVQCLSECGTNEKRLRKCKLDCRLDVPQP